MSETSSQVRERKLTGNHITIIIVAALVTVVPGAAFATVAATRTAVVDAKTGQTAEVSNGGQLHVRGDVTTSDIVPTNSWHSYVHISTVDKPINGTWILTGTPAGYGLEIGELSVTGSSPSLPEVILLASYVPSQDACPSSLPIFNADDSRILWTGEATSATTGEMEFTFPIPLTVEPRAGDRSCTYVYLAGYSNTALVSAVGAKGVTR